MRREGKRRPWESPWFVCEHTATQIRSNLKTPALNCGCRREQWLSSCTFSSCFFLTCSFHCFSVAVFWSTADAPIGKLIFKVAANSKNCCVTNHFFFYVVTFHTGFALKNFMRVVPGDLYTKTRSFIQAFWQWCITLTVSGRKQHICLFIQFNNLYFLCLLLQRKD